MRVKEIMSRNPACCTPDTRLQQVARIMRDYDCGMVPVVEDVQSLRLAGVVTDRDIACRAVAERLDPLETTAQDCMSSPAIAVSPEDTLEECCDLLERRQIRRAPVVDEDGRCCGIVALADLARVQGLGKACEVLRGVSQPAGTVPAKASR